MNKNIFNKVKVLFKKNLGLVIVLGTASVLVSQLVWPAIVGAEMVPQNKVGISMFGFHLSGDYSEVDGQPTGPGQIKNGNVGAYPEGTCVPIEIEVTNNSDQPGDIIISPVYDYWGDGDNVIGIDNLEKITTSLSGDPNDSADNLNDFIYSETPLTTTDTFNSSGGAIAAVVNGPYASSTDGTLPITPTDDFRHYNIMLNNVPAGVTVYVIFCGRLGIDASQYNGSKMSIRTAQGGQENVPISANLLLSLPSITLTKTVQGGTATPDQWSFNVTPAINGQSVYPISAGQDTVAIDNVSPDGDYTITENGPADYIFASGSGNNCVFNGSTAVASVTAGKPAQNAICNFVNQYNPPTTGTLTVTKIVVNDNGGDKQVSDFPLFVGSDPITSGVPVTLNAGNYVVGETNQAGYESTFGGACDADGNVAIGIGEDITCTLTNDDIAPTLTVNKVLNPTDDAGLFNLLIDLVEWATNVGNGGSTGAVSLNAGSHQISETAGDNTDLSNYIATISGDCGAQGNINLAIGENKTCTIFNVLKQGGIVVMKETLPDQDPTLFNFTANYSAPFSLSDGQMNNSGSLDPGVYSVSEDLPAGWTLKSATCSDGSDPSAINLSPDETVTCLFTNSKLSQISGMKFNDLDNNGQKDNGEPGLDNWTINLTLPDQSVVSTQTTGGGLYSFADLPVGDYTVCEVGQTNWTQTWPTANQGCYPITLSQDTSNLDFGNYYQAPQPNTYSISGLKFNDQNNNGVNDQEPGLLGWTINLAGTASASAQTDSQGNYSFTGLLAGDYTICETQQNGWSQTYPTGNNGCYTFALSQNTIGIDFGNYQNPVGPTEPICGNSIIEQGEGCDDGNTSNGDGCSAVCAIEEPTQPPQSSSSSSTSGTTSYKITVDKTSVEEFTSPGAIVNFTIAIANTGSGIIYNLTVTDTLPSGFVYVDTGLSMRQWEIAGLKVGDIEKITYQAKTAGDIALGTYTNTAKVEASAITDPISDDATIEVRNPQVLGMETTSPAENQEGSVLGMTTLPATGADLFDLVIWLLGSATLTIGIFGLKKTLKRNLTAV